LFLYSVFRMHGLAIEGAMQFLIFPDCPAGEQLAIKLPAAQQIRHSSGRPWIIGDWDRREVTTIGAGARQLVLIGPSSVDEGAAARALAQLGTLHDADRIASRTHGACHLSVSMDGQTRVQGSVSGARQVFTAVVNGVTVAASGVAPLLRLAGTSQLDEAVVAARLLSPSGAPWPLALRPAYRGIHPLAAGHWLMLGSDGREAQVRWWQLPPASRSLADAADDLRSALLASLSARASLGGTVTADLSGGLDSTSVCFLARAAGLDLVTYHVTPLDAANEDTAWAAKAAALLPGARHHTLPADRAENWFTAGYDPDDPDVDPEGPATWASGLPHIRELALRAVAEGAAVHLTGFGGDELFGRMPAGAWSLMRARPVRALPLVNRYRLANRWSWAPTLRSLLDGASFTDSLARVARDVADRPRPLSKPDFGWAFAAHLPPWATRDAASAVRQLIGQAVAAGPSPLDGDRSRHQAMASLIFEGSTIRQINTVLGKQAIAWDAPFLDDRVIEAALSARVDQRLAGGRYKPLLTSAMRGIVPADILGRGDKGEFSAEGFRGIKRNREFLLGLCEGSRLAELGLIDIAAFRSVLLNPGLMSEDLQPIQATVACESWLRTHSWRRERGEAAG
jgi:asparagine synthase (glutamine-hydrolysing)